MSDAIVLPAGRTAWFISDLHLWAGRRQTIAAFYAMLVRAPEEADALFILGDLFEFWIGDDDLDNPAVAPIVAALRAATQRGLRLWLLRGNRDVLIGRRFAQAAGATLIESDEARVEIGETAAIILHGDTLCTDDVSYQRYRRFATNRTVQRLLLSMPRGLRARLIQGLRTRSEARHQHRPNLIVDVNSVAVDQAYGRHGLGTMIHGHTHRAARHQDDAGRTRWVLPDWEFDGPTARGGPLEWRGGDRFIERRIA